MINKFNEAEALLNAIASKLPFIDSSDYSILADVMQNLELLEQDSALPKAFQNQAKRTAQLAKKMILEEISFANGLKKLVQSIEKMVTSFEGIANKNIQKAESDSAEQSEQSIPDDVKDLVIKFSTQQAQVLENFEGLCLDFEKNNPEAQDGIKRILHTWKGEFGVLSLQKYSKLIHKVEEKLERKNLSSESLFRLKDFLTERFSRFATGEYPLLSAADEEYLFVSLAKDELNMSVNKQRKKTHTAESSSKSETEDNQRKKEDEINTETSSDSLAYQGDPSLLTDFIAESREHIDNVEPLLLDLEKNPFNHDHLNTIFRACHTIKGVAGFLSLEEIGKLAHNMENFLDLGRKKEVILKPGHIDVLLQGMDCLRSMINSVEEVIAGDRFKIPQTFESICEKLSDPHTIVDPPQPLLKKVGEILVDRGEADAQEVEQALQKQQNGDTRKLGEILVEDNGTSPDSIAEALVSQQAAKRMKKSVEETIRVPVERLDQLIDSIGEAVIAQSMVNADPALRSMQDRSLEKKISQASLIMRQIQELSMSLRMVSIKSTFQKMARIVRDLSKKKQKEVDLIMEGEDTELDKTVVENIGDPLMHMIRNSIDHGIETVEERKRKGKSKKAKINLRAYHKAGSVVIEIEDDGVGLDKDAILMKAREKGLVKKDESFTDQEIYQFIFLPGFSTAKVVTDVSGRGVGMDVVRRNIEALRGSTEIRSEKERGTCFAIKLPLTLAIIDGMLVRVGKEIYIIPTLSIVESLKAKTEQIDFLLGKGATVKVRERLHTLVQLSEIFGKKKNGNDLTQGIIMIVEDMLGKKIGLYVDDILGQQQVVIKSLGAGMQDVPGVTGGAIMSDGNVSLILDIGGIVKMATQ